LARRAFNYAVDRRKAAELMGGPSVAKITCQLIPPTMPSYKPYCPYTKGSSGNVYRGPDISRANDLVTASGTRGMKVTVTDVLGDYNPPLNAYFAQVLRTLGYKVTLRRLPLRKEYLLYDRRGRIQVESGGWIADFPLPSSFYEILSCTPPAGGYPLAYCNRRLDRRATAATIRRQNPERPFAPGPPSTERSPTMRRSCPS
jgi:peptide/nickel transport system substrate-binding protein